ncbi:MAG: hypothetical protein K0S37_2377 [Microbacterium sp.]|jgi:hypothetical protein|nr:hypothetical protein [Microbacterium sp.]
MTDSTTLDAVEEQIDLTLGGMVEIGTSSSLGHRTVHLHVEDQCGALTADEAIAVVHALMRCVDAIGFPEPADVVEAPAPVVVTRVLPSDDPIFIGVRA